MFLLTYLQILINATVTEQINNKKNNYIMSYKKNNNFITNY